MSAGTWFWLLYILAAIGSVCGYYWLWPIHANFLIVFILLGLLGFKVFGSPVQ